LTGVLFSVADRQGDLGNNIGLGGFGGDPGVDVGVCEDVLSDVGVGRSELRLSDAPNPIVGLLQEAIYIATSVTESSNGDIH